MNLILTSDFPSTSNPAVVARLKAVAAEPRIAWIPPVTDTDGMHFTEAGRRFSDAGFDQLEYLDIDEDLDQVQLAYLHEFDVIFLSGGDPVRFRYNAIRAGLSGRLRQCAALGRLIVGASGGALLLTPNVSLFRLQSESVEEVVTTRGRFEALGAVTFELLPHVNRLDAAFIDKVRRYSERTDTDVVAVADGGAVFATSPEAFEHVGTITRYRRGEIIATDPPTE
ncbi:MAG TPA: Type 1 glutamine amidotransferase-like domain-containing protein [Vicinamibacterales bacterium]|nr:Type 1 glutamine amidotransferase-like domain-containing protein [Vicinamibacterales bacterium]